MSAKENVNAVAKNVDTDTAEVTVAAVDTAKKNVDANAAAVGSSSPKKKDAEDTNPSVNYSNRALTSSEVSMLIRVLFIGPETKKH